MKLLVATDFSPAFSAVGSIKARAWPEGTEVYILHVVDLPPFEAGAELLETARRGAESIVRALAADLERAGLKAQADVVIGHPRTAIPDYAKKYDANWVIVGSHGANALARLFLGSVAQAVVRAAPCSVEVARPGAGDAARSGSGFKILVATDGSECARLAVRSVAERPWPARSVARIVSVAPSLNPVISSGGAPYFETADAVELAQRIEAEERSRAAEVIAEAEKILEKASGLEVEKAEVVNGDPKRIIVQQAKEWGATMVVVGSHGRHGLDRLMTGSVSEFVATHAHCSVEVVR